MTVKNFHPKLSAFQKRLYLKLRQVPCGKVTTYQDLAHAVGSKAYRAVGTAMNKNPFAPEVPCHRVVKANGEIGEFAYGSVQKTALLLAEGVEIIDGKIDLTKFRHHFESDSGGFANVETLNIL
jgi:methylated-DNA-[protein]-cysteine S-methyltransferase